MRQCGTDGTGAGGYEPLQQHQEADIVTLFPQSLVIALADVLGHGVVESC